ncbi:hypothetical protein JMM61_18015 [Rhodovulum sulfidophilum]|uniref:hypothetical protein n=1 Tax=Rhodovulum sulfidophilum TaxID=35806 RepID=UPI001927A5A0|nr:hypothetical protein [Rhodovulum sulfidophilum]MBL3587252.1 hypothetical protein [Rhodovulum sulfidophilum]
MNIHGNTAFAQRIATYSREADMAGIRSPDFEKDVAETGEMGPRVRPHGAAAIADIFARHDMTSISPCEIDTMAEQLRDAGFDDFDFLLGLETYGEKFQSHLVEAIQSAGIETRHPDYTQPMDLISVNRDQLAHARRAGAPTEWRETFLSRLEAFQTAAHPAPTGLSTAESLVLARAT